MEVRKRRSPAGKLMYVMDYRHNGERRRVTLKGVRSMSEAREVAELRYGELKRKEALGELAGPTVAEKCLTLKQLIDRDVERTGIADRTRRAEKEHAKPLFRILGENTRVMSLTTGLIEEFKRSRAKEGMAPRTINLTLQHLRAALNRAHRTRLISRVPCSIKKIPEPQKKHRFLKPEEVDRIITASKEIPGLHGPLTVLANTGLRPVELWRIRWSDVDLDNGTLTVESHKRGANGSSRVDTIPLNTQALAVFSKRAAQGPGHKPEPEHYVFGITPEQRGPCRNGKRKSAKGHNAGVLYLGDHRFVEKLKRAARLAKIDRPEQVHPYMLRHSFASNVLASGATVKDTQALLRHASPLITLTTYCHESLPAMKAAVDRIATTGCAIIPEDEKKATPSSRGHIMGTRAKKRNSSNCVSSGN